MTAWRRRRRFVRRVNSTITGDRGGEGGGLPDGEGGGGGGLGGGGQGIASGRPILRNQKKGLLGFYRRPRMK